MKTAEEIIYKPIRCEERLPKDYATIHIVLVDGRIPMMAQFRPDKEWWTLGMSNAKRLDKGVTHWLEVQASLSQQPLSGDRISAKKFLKLHRVYEDDTIYNSVDEMVGTLTQLMEEYASLTPNKEKTAEVYVTYDKSDGEVFCAFISKEQCEKEAKECGCGMQTIRLVAPQEQKGTSHE